MRLLAVTPYYAPEGGGLERYAHAILTRLAARGHDVQVVSFTRQAPADQEHDGVPVRRLRAPLHLGRTPLDPGLYGRVRRAIRAFRPDVVLAHTPVPFPAEMAYLAARRTGTPFVTTYHAGRLRGSSPALDRLAALDRLTVERAMLNGSRRLIAVGPYVRDNALAGQNGRVSIIPPGVDPARFRPGRGPAGPDILFVGPLARSYAWKGIDVLWDAFARVQERMPDARLTLVGDGDRAEEFLTRAARSAGVVRVHRRLDEAALARAYQQAAVVVLPSTTDAESFGMVLAEANACGRPVVASRIGGIPDFVRHGDNGLLARPGDPADLAQQILPLLQDPARAQAMGRRGLARVRRHHDWDRLAEDTEFVLTGALRP